MKTRQADADIKRTFFCKYFHKIHKQNTENVKLIQLLCHLHVHSPQPPKPLVQPILALSDFYATYAIAALHTSLVSKINSLIRIVCDCCQWLVSAAWWKSHNLQPVKIPQNVFNLLVTQSLVMLVGVWVYQASSNNTIAPWKEIAFA